MDNTMLEVKEKIITIEKDVEVINSRLGKIEEKQESFNELVICVKELALNMKNMTEVQKKQNERLERLEQEPLNNARFIKREIIKVIISVVVGGLLGALLALIIK